MERLAALALCAKVASASKAPAAAAVASAEGPLSSDAWAEVLSHLGARAYEPRGLVGVCVAARWLGTAAAVCRDLRVAARGATADLGAAVAVEDVEEALEGDGEDGMDVADPEVAALVERVLHAPTSCTVPQLRGVARALGVAVGGIKAELVARLLRELRLGDRPAPAHVPARLVLRAYLERARWTRDLGTLTRPMEAALARAFMTLKCGRDPRVTGMAGRATRLSDLQVALCDAFPATEGGGDTHGQQLLRAARQHEREEVVRKRQEAEQRRQEEVQRRQEAEKRRQEAEQRRLEFVCCVQCRHNGSAKGCPHTMCGDCCKGCIRHKRNKTIIL